MLPDVTAEELTAALDDCVERLLEEQQVSRPPVDATAIARGLGMSLAWDSAQAGRARVVRLSAAGGRQSRPSILLRPDPRPERQQWAVAHEIGETCAQQLFATLGMDALEAQLGARERLANLFAGRLLLPTRWFHRDALRADWDLLELKYRYTTASHEMIARRMLDFDPWIVITIFDQGESTFRSTNRGGRCGDLLPIENACWREVHEKSRPAKSNHPGQAVRGWPIHEPQWKREILRLEFSESMDD